MKIVLSFCLLVLVFASCRKPENRTCFKGWGDETSIEVNTGSFNKLFLNAHLEYVMVQDSTDKLVIKGGSNVVNHVKYEVSDDGLLTISNGNRCNFLRDGRKVIVVEIHYTNVYNIRFEGTEPLSNVGVHKTDYFTMFIRDGAGPVTLNIDCINVSSDISHGWGNYTFTGHAKYAIIGARSNGYCDTRGLVVDDSIYVANESSGKLKVNADGIPMRGYLKSNGNIEYCGTPTLVDIVKTGNGEVVKL